MEKTWDTFGITEVSHFIIESIKLTCKVNIKSDRKIKKY